MSKNHNKLFSIGQFAALHQINKKTLMWYDEVGLFRPAVVRENGYRYYTYQQSSILETILMLRELDVPISEIKTFLDHKVADSFHAVLSDQANEVDKAIERLLQIKKALLYHKQNLEYLKTIDLSKYSIVEKAEERLVMLKITKDTPPEQETEMIFEEAGHHRACRMYGILYGSILPVTSLYQHDFEDYSGIFLKIPEAKLTTNVHIRPAGRYLRTFSKGSWDRLPQKYEEILRHATEHHIEFRGYAYETGINDIVCNSMEDYITQIEIPIKG